MPYFLPGCGRTEQRTELRRTFVLYLELEDVDSGPSAPSIEHDAILEAPSGGSSGGRPVISELVRAGPVVGG